MYKYNDQLFFSPSDLTKFMVSPFASWMDRYVIEYPNRAPMKDKADVMMDSLAQKGYEHEDALEQTFFRQGKSVVKIEASTNEEKKSATILAMQQGVEVIVQARLELNQFSGFADFLIKVNHGAGDADSHFGDWHYEVWDTKLASKVKPTFIVQLCCYAQMLEAVQGIKPEYITVALGSEENIRLRTDDYFSYYKTLKQSFLDAQASFNPNELPDPAESQSFANWSNYAKSLLLEKDHLFQVATITKGQIAKLNKAGILTMQALADCTLQHVPGIQSEVLSRLVAQASIQIASKGHAVPEYRILMPKEGVKSGLALLPPSSPLDVFFDIEGYPLDKGGLEYLWGNTYLDDVRNRQFKDFWAHNPEQEKQCFQDFIAWVYERWKRDPSMHIYHYAAYEITACKKLMSRYGVCEEEVDQLLRNEVFVDLYKIVKGSMLLGEPRYSIKNVEHLYRGKRDTEVGNGGESVVVYEKWRELNKKGLEGNTWETSKILNDIRKYNIDDCNSTLELVDWLRVQQAEHYIAYLGKKEIVEPEIKEEIRERNKLCARLLERAELEKETDPVQAALTENLAHVLDFHRREAKPVFWRLFERLGLRDMELMDDLDCLAACVRTATEPYKATPRSKNLCYEYRFDTSQEFKGGSDSYYLLGVETEDGKSAKVSASREFSKFDEGIIVLSAKQEPPQVVTLVPDEIVGTHPIPQAIERTVAEYERGELVPGGSAILDFLLRSKPRIKGHDGGPIVTSHEPNERLNQIISAVENLDSSYLTIQGPPGAGKSYTGKHVIAALLKQGARVGIASNSHKAINNLLLSTAKYAKEKGIKATFACTKETEPDLAANEVFIIQNANLVNNVAPSCVLGTTAWGFAREDMENQLDYLFVDEAGQVAIANLIAMSRSTKNLILMGDQMQLGQPSQGAHPADSGLSILDYLLRETPAISDDMGVFLGMTYRMHSAVNRFISQHVYDGKLESHVSNDERVIDVPEGYKGPLDINAGLVFVPVEHEGNTQASDEEVDVIKALANDILGRTLHTGDENQPTKSIDWDDILFVAPYNHQVTKLRSALGEHAKVGSVDKFQGQEAPIVFMSMCASDANESPRGINFLFDKHRINVAISRAQSLAIVVANPRIGQTTASDEEQLKKISLFAALIHQSS